MKPHMPGIEVGDEEHDGLMHLAEPFLRTDNEQWEQLWYGFPGWPRITERLLRRIRHILSRYHDVCRIERRIIESKGEGEVPGWIDNQWDLDHDPWNQFNIDQVKEKFGTLRFYYSWTDDSFSDAADDVVPGRIKQRVRGAVDMAHDATGEFCMYCECPGELRDHDPVVTWVRVLCDDCYEEEAERTDERTKELVEDDA